MAFFSSSHDNSGRLIGIAAVLGIASGLYVQAALPYAGALAALVSSIAKIFIDLMQLISLPVIFLSIVSTIISMENYQEMKEIGIKALKYTLLTTIISASIGLLLFIVINPVRSVADTLSAAGTLVTTGKSYLSFVLEIIPNNIIKTLGDNSKVMSVVFIAALLSFSIASLPTSQKIPLQGFFSGLFAAVLNITKLIIMLMPLGVWSFTSGFVTDIAKTHNSGDINSIILYVLCVILANVLQGFITIPALLKAKGLSPLRALRGMSKALTIAFFSKSSNATLPITLKCAQENLGVSPRVANFTLPLCTVINMNGCAAFILITVLFVGMKGGLVFSLYEMLGWVCIATLAAIGNAGVPMGCYFLASAFLVGMGIPEEALRLLFVILPVYTILDMIETALNVWSDAAVTLIIDKELSTGKPASEREA